MLRAFLLLDAVDWAALLAFAVWTSYMHRTVWGGMVSLYPIGENDKGHC